MTTRKETPPAPWTEAGWIVEDEYHRWHGTACVCVQDDSPWCKSPSLTPFPTQAEAQTHAHRLEMAQGYACTARAMQVR